MDPFLAALLPVNLWEDAFLSEELDDPQFASIGGLIRVMLNQRLLVKGTGGNISLYSYHYHIARAWRSGYLQGTRAQYMDGQHYLHDLIIQLSTEHAGCPCWQYVGTPFYGESGPWY